MKSLSGWTLLLLTCMLAGAPALAQNGQRSTNQGVYSKEQWTRGRDLYDGLCVSCHVAATHVGPVFTKSWAGKKLSDLFRYLREQMPKNEPGSMSDKEYVDVMSYMLSLNGMPAGPVALPVDSVALSKIRIDSSRVSPP